ncbi:MAG: hypothetical protein ACYTBS_01210 [Planctomycetota bacterium]|jgi:hypothetical protein
MTVNEMARMESELNTAKQKAIDQAAGLLPEIDRQAELAVQLLEGYRCSWAARLLALGMLTVNHGVARDELDRSEADNGGNTLKW